MNLIYLAALLVSLSGMVALDWRHRLSFWRDVRMSALTLIACVGVFLAWDAGGVANGIFFRGDSTWMTGIVIAPEIPLEEVFFLTLLTYLTMNVFVASPRWLAARGSRQ